MKCFTDMLQGAPEPAMISSGVSGSSAKPQKAVEGAKVSHRPLALWYAGSSKGLPV